jgi:maltose alpha-D-glucosyltransferase / alpha-amylase
MSVDQDIGLVLRRRRRRAETGRPSRRTRSSDPAWYKQAIVYELHVRTFHDSDGDGIGDFPGLTAKLDYLHDLGITAIWLLPFYPSPLRDDGYDIADYTNVHPDCGTLRDFRTFLREAHGRGLRVITELVLNHTSDAHAWFQRARRAPPGSTARNFYVWSEDPNRYKDARVIFNDFESSNWSWDPVASAYYWHRFYSHQPDLNYRNSAVVRAISRVLDFWLRLGVDGVRLDAVPYLIEAEGTTSENLAQTHAVLKRLRRHVDERFADRMLLAEANQWPEDAASYFGNGDECHMAFHFPLMPRLFIGIRQEDRFPIVDVLAQTPAIPDPCQWALFLRNHDELTLEMVAEEERLFMYSAYTDAPEARINFGIRRRLAPLLGGDRRKIELMNALLFSLPGTPVVYYGDEIGMGDNIFLGDRNGIRTPMQWSGERNGGFSSADVQRLYLPLIVDYEYHHQTIQVETQQRNRDSLLWWMKHLIRTRRRYAAFGQGTLEFCHPSNRSVLAFIRRWQREAILVVANLSKFDQYVELDLSAFQGRVPIELMGQTPFPPIGNAPYPLTLGPHGFLWLLLDPASTMAPSGRSASRATILRTRDSWENLVLGRDRAALEQILPRYLRTRPWFTERRRRILSASIVEALRVPNRTEHGFIALVRVEYSERQPDIYVLPLGWAMSDRARDLLRQRADLIIARAKVDGRDDSTEGVVYDAIAAPHCAAALLEVAVGHRHLKGTRGQLVGVRTPGFRNVKTSGASAAGIHVVTEELSNSTLAYSNIAVLKLFRKVDGGVHPDFAIGDFLTRRDFKHAPTVAGALEYRRPRSLPIVVGVLQRFIPHDGNGWDYTLRMLDRFSREVRGQPEPTPAVTLSADVLLTASEHGLPEQAEERLADYVPVARRLGELTGQMHRVLGSAAHSHLAPEPFSSFYQRSAYQSLRGMTCSVIDALRAELPRLPAGLQPNAARVIASQDRLLDHFRGILGRKLTAMRIACHGNYHLQQVLCTEGDFTIIDFEGEPPRPLSERRLKRSPLVDIVSMVRSFHYAARVALTDDEKRAASRDRRAWSLFWGHWSSVAFLQAYFSAVDQELLPSDRADLHLLLDMHLFQRTLYELGHELTHRPDWVWIPLKDLEDLLVTLK